MQLLRMTSCLAAVTLVLGMFACSDQPTAGDRSPQTTAEDFFDRAPATGFGALEWLEPVAEGIETLQEIGPSGGVIRLAGTGVQIRFPAGAVSENLKIEARALPGSVVAFEFGAHGLIFQAPVEIRIEGDRLGGSWLDGEAEEIFDGTETRRYLLGLLGVYFVGDPASKVTPLETFPIYLDDGDVVLEITHFSGYAVASG